MTHLHGRASQDGLLRWLVTVTPAKKLSEPQIPEKFEASNVFGGLKERSYSEQMFDADPNRFSLFLSKPIRLSSNARNRNAPSFKSDIARAATTRPTLASRRVRLY
ncbi:hypothetical protein ACT2FY_27140 [Paraburkholderia fungorum]|uniref:hypothetical protein n=1 Tax=Paraburkholderia fungorum TaxID=134537 RepID=UPI00402BCB07